jgi:hypothetical protein
MIKKLLIPVLLLSCIAVHAQTVLHEHIGTGIKSVIFIKKGFPISYPVLEMREETPLLLSFDDLSDSPGNYYYSITLCNSDWTESRLSPSEYSQGLLSFPVNNYQHSVNTLISYTHYEIELPNNDLQLVLPGNYIIKYLKTATAIIRF